MSCYALKDYRLVVACIYRRRSSWSGMNTSLHSTPVAGGGSAKQSKHIQQSHHSVTSVICGSDNNHFLSSSTSSASGIRLWDIRYQKLSSPLRIYDVPQRQHGKHSGRWCSD